MRSIPPNVWTRVTSPETGDTLPDLQFQRSILEKPDLFTPLVDCRIILPFEIEDITFCHGGITIRLTDERRPTMGDKGGKKDKEKGQKQKQQKHQQEDKARQDKLPKKTK